MRWPGIYLEYWGAILIMVWGNLGAVSHVGTEYVRRAPQYITKAQLRLGGCCSVFLSNALARFTQELLLVTPICCLHSIAASKLVNMFSKEERTVVEDPPKDDPVMMIESASSSDNDLGFDEKMTAKLVRKVDLYLVPFLSLLYLLSYLDRTNIGNARLGGLEKDLGMSGLDYNVSVCGLGVSRD